MINAGAIMTSSMLKHKVTPANRFNHISSTLANLSNSHKITFNNAVYNSEKETADRNYALGYFMKEHSIAHFQKQQTFIKHLIYIFRLVPLRLIASIWQLLPQAWQMRVKIPCL